MIIVMEHYRKSDLQNNRWLTFVFGDNDQRTGHGGQAKACRDEPNALGIRVKKAPALTPSAYYTDEEFAQNKIKIDQDIDAIEALLEKHHPVVFPAVGVGTGLANLRVCAPDTFMHLHNRLWHMKENYMPKEVTYGPAIHAIDVDAYTIVPRKPIDDTITRLGEIILKDIVKKNVATLWGAKTAARKLYCEIAGPVLQDARFDQVYD